MFMFYLQLSLMLQPFYEATSHLIVKMVIYLFIYFFSMQICHQVLIIKYSFGEWIISLAYVAIV